MQDLFFVIPSSGVLGSCCWLVNRRCFFHADCLNAFWSSCCCTEMAVCTRALSRTLPRSQLFRLTLGSRIMCWTYWEEMGMVLEPFPEGFNLLFASINVAKNSTLYYHCRCFNWILELLCLETSSLRPTLFILMLLSWITDRSLICSYQPWVTLLYPWHMVLVGMTLYFSEVIELLLSSVVLAGAVFLYASKKWASRSI